MKIYYWQGKLEKSASFSQLKLSKENFLSSFIQTNHGIKCILNILNHTVLEINQITINICLYIYFYHFGVADGFCLQYETTWEPEYSFDHWKVFKKSIQWLFCDFYSCPEAVNATHLAQSSVKTNTKHHCTQYLTRV